MNTSKFPLNNVLVRKAIAAAISRDAIAKLVSVRPAHTFAPPVVLGLNEDGKKLGIPFDIKQSQSWMAESGYPKGKGFPPITYFYNEGGTQERLGKAIQYMLKEVLNIELS